MHRKKMIRRMANGAALGAAAGAFIAVTRSIRPNKRLVRAVRSIGPSVVDFVWGYLKSRGK